MIVFPKLVRARGDVSLTHDMHTHAHTHARTHARKHARAHARTHARTHACMHARTHARTRANTSREREKLRAQRALKQSDKRYTHTKHTNTNKTPFFFLVFESFLKLPKGQGIVGKQFLLSHRNFYLFYLLPKGRARFGKFQMHCPNSYSFSDYYLLFTKGRVPFVEFQIHVFSNHLT